MREPHDPSETLRRSSPGSSYEPSGAQIRPWVRYWARSMDLALFAVLIGLSLMYLNQDMDELSDALYGMLLMMLYVFAEATMLSLWCTTPGKYLLNIRLRNADDSKLTFAQALGRSSSVWIRGEGVGIPLVGAFTQLMAYSHLKNQNITKWDANGRHKVNHREIEAWRVLVFFVAFVSMLSLAVYG